MTSLHHAASATAGDVDLIAVAVVAGLLLAAGYAVSCAIWPFAACRWCDGTGKNRSPSGRAWRPCQHCRGSGARVRLGRQLLTHARRVRDRGTRPHRRITRWKDTSK